MAIMVSPRFSMFLLIILIFLLVRCSSGHAQQVTSTGIKLQTDKSSVNAVMKSEMQQGVPAGAGMDHIHRTRFLPRNRKMKPRRLSKLMESEQWMDAESSTTDGKDHCIERCEREAKGDSNVKRKFSERSRHSMRVKMSGFVSWNADYHVPRPHPPKNN